MYVHIHPQTVYEPFPFQIFRHKPKYHIVGDISQRILHIHIPTFCCILENLLISHYPPKNDLNLIQLKQNPTQDVVGYVHLLYLSACLPVYLSI